MGDADGPRSRACWTASFASTRRAATTVLRRRAPSPRELRAPDAAVYRVDPREGRGSASRRRRRGAGASSSTMSSKAEYQAFLQGAQSGPSVTVTAGPYCDEDEVREWARVPRAAVLRRPGPFPGRPHRVRNGRADPLRGRRGPHAALPGSARRGLLRRPASPQDRMGAARIGGVGGRGSRSGRSRTERGLAEDLL